jgi:hypothetical protein
MDLSYRFAIRGHDQECFREAADPSVVSYHGRYWLFPSKTGGYWHSPDLQNWTLVESRALPTEDYAPDVCVIDGALYFTASSGKAPIFRTTRPEADAWEKVSDPLGYTDPKIFQDDDGRVYLYWGCSNRDPLNGVEMDRRTLLPLGARVELVHGRADAHGWERRGDDCRGDNSPYIEGVWMNKHHGRYYLQYAAPGTEFNVYGDGVYESDRPLGPFTYARHNPFSFKPGGFITGAGHGSTFYDRFDNLWHIATMRISIKHMFERRLGLFPAGFDADGHLFCNTVFGDYPLKLPDRKWDPWRDPFAGWMLLSYRKPARASSAEAGQPPELAFNEDVRTYWSAASGAAGEWLETDLQEPCLVHAVQINFAEHRCRQYGREGAPLCHRYLLEASADGRTWQKVLDRRDGVGDTPHAYCELSEPLPARYFKLTNFGMPGGGTFAVSGLRIFGKGPGPLPAPVTQLRAGLDPADPLTARVTWEPARGALGYNVRWGIAPDKLYNCWMVYDQTALELRALNRDVPYWVAVDAFNAAGVTPGAAAAVAGTSLHA